MVRQAEMKGMVRELLERQKKSEVEQASVRETVEGLRDELRQMMHLVLQRCSSSPAPLPAEPLAPRLGPAEIRSDLLSPPGVEGGGVGKGGLQVRGRPLEPLPLPLPSPGRQRPLQGIGTGGVTPASATGLARATARATPADDELQALGSIPGQTGM